MQVGNSVYKLVWNTGEGIYDTLSTTPADATMQFSALCFIENLVNIAAHGICRNLKQKVRTEIRSYASR